MYIIDWKSEPSSRKSEVNNDFNAKYKAMKFKLNLGETKYYGYISI